MEIQYPGVPPELDPAKITTPNQIVVLTPIYDRLTTVDLEGNVEPMLATEWSYSDDGTALTMTLRDDVTFHDGSPVDAEAVKANIERGQTLEGSTLAGLLAPITSVEVGDATTISFGLEPGTGAELPAVFAGLAGVVVNPVALTDGRDLSGAPGEDAGSGPYVVTDYSPGELVTYSRAPQEPWEPVAGRLKGFTLRAVTTTQTAVNGLRAGQFQIALASLDAVSDAQALVESGGAQGQRYFTGVIASVMMRVGGPLADVRVREAIARAVDKRSIAEELFEGNCQVVTQPVSPEHWSYDDDLDGVDYDPEAAAALLEEVDVDGLTLRMGILQNSQVVAYTTVVQANLAEIGIDVEVSQMTPADLLAQWDAGEIDLAGWPVIPNLDPSVMLTENYLGGALHLASSDPGELATLAGAATDPRLDQEARASAFSEVWEHLAETHFNVNICSQSGMWLWEDGIGGMEQALSLYPASAAADFRYAFVRA